jgi:DNA-binding XRE family transcriptional regulator
MLKLKELRLEKGYSVPKLSELSGIHRRTIQDIEKRGDCMLSTAFKLAKVLNVTLNDIYTPDEAEE